jgi:hypothetical protein
MQQRAVGKSHKVFGIEPDRRVEVLDSPVVQAQLRKKQRTPMV